MALTLWVPTEKELTTRLALPELSIAAGPRGMDPSANATTPVGIAEELLQPATVAVRITFWPKTLGFGDPASVVVVAPLLTICETGPDVELEKLVSPAYSALML